MSRESLLNFGPEDASLALFSRSDASRADLPTALTREPRSGSPLTGARGFGGREPPEKKLRFGLGSAIFQRRDASGDFGTRHAPPRQAAASWRCHGERCSGWRPAHVYAHLMVGMRVHGVCGAGSPVATELSVRRACGRACASPRAGASRFVWGTRGPRQNQNLIFHLCESPLPFLMFSCRCA